MEIFKIVGVGILTCIIAIILKQIKPEFLIIVILSGGIIMFLMVLDKLKSILDYILTIFNKTNLDYSLFVSILKILGVGYITEFANNICIDSGHSSIGEKILIAGKVIILGLALPIFTSLLNIIIELL
ncbi:MAG: stage III sporulation protein AD [Clostridiales bacterium]|nr:stage III sporulation protein AD [Clostridiales bacterium]MBR4003712.1 stage III sporulation protein AD [Clostridia bacterium]